MSVNKPKVRSLASGDVLFREGEVGDFAYQITSGEIEICKFTGDEYVTLSKLKKGDLFGEMALIDRQPRSAMARATKETIVKEKIEQAKINNTKKNNHIITASSSVRKFKPLGKIDLDSNPIGIIISLGCSLSFQFSA